MTDYDPRALLVRFHRGDRDALTDLIEHQMEWLRGYVRKRLGQHLRAHDDSIDFVQQALLDLIARDATIRIEDESGLRALLAQIVEHDLRDKDKWRRRQKRDPAREQGDASDSQLQSFKDVTTPSIAAERRETAQWMQKALDELPAGDREIIRLHEWERLGYDEIGERLGITPNAARVRFQRALPKLALAVAKIRGSASG